MNQKDQLKVLKAGFTIIRKEESALKIKYKCDDDHNWKTLSSGYASKAAMQREMDQLLKSSNIIED